MRNARPFIASIPLTLVLVAALLVALRATTGAFGFDAWPTSSGAAAAPQPIAVQVPVARQPVSAVVAPVARTHVQARLPARVERVPARTAPVRPVPVPVGASPRSHTPAPAVVRNTPAKPAPEASVQAPTVAPEHPAQPTAIPQQARAEMPAQPPLHDAAAAPLPSA